MPIAQLNIGRLNAPIGDPSSREFFDNLDTVNALAERSPGFVWRLVDDAVEGSGMGDATSIPVTDDPMLLANMSVWETPEDLARFVFRTVHARFYHKRGDWFERLSRPHMVIWPVAAGHIPTLEEALERLADLERDGPTERAYGWETLAGAQEIQRQRCA